MDRNYNTGLFFRGLLFVFAAMVVHALALRFIYPGYYSPLYPHHSDFYIPVALAHSPGDFFQYRYMGYSRPLGLFLLKCEGMLGIHGSILCTILIVAVNVSLSAILFCTIFPIRFSWRSTAAFSLYCYLIFTQPFLYTFYTQDVMSHLSYFFLIAGTLYFCTYQEHNFRRSCIVLGLATLIGLLCKETYCLSAIALSLCWIFYNGRERIKNTVWPLIVISGALIFVMVFNLSIKSVFTSFSSGDTDPYHIDLRPVSIFTELYHYLKEEFNFLNLGCIVLSAALLYVMEADRKKWWLFFGCVLAGVLSLVPNSIIPRHHISGYSYNGGLLFYLPLLAAGGSSGSASRPIPGQVAISAMTFILCLLSPISDKEKFAGQGWILEQEDRQRHILHSLDTLMAGLKDKDNQHILVSGLNMPFFPFHHPGVLLEFPGADRADYTVINYSGGPNIQAYRGVSFLKPEEIDPGHYTAVWIFSNDGQLSHAESLSGLDSAGKATILKNIR